MPCDSIKLTAVALDKANPDMMLESLRQLGLKPRLEGDTIHFGRGEQINVKTGESRLSTGREVNEIKRAYSTAVVNATAKKFGWTAQQTKQVQGQTVMGFTKR